MLKSRSLLLAVALCLSALFAAPLVSHAGDGKGKSKKKDKKAAKHLEYRKTYEDALLEARIRNLPVFISRHKDF